MPLVIPIEGAGDSPVDLVTTIEAGCMGSVSIVYTDEEISTGSVDIVGGDSFIILADILAEELAGDDLDEDTGLGSGSFSYANLGARLVVNGDTENPVAIKSFDFQVSSTGRLGSILNVVLAEPDITVIPANANIKFEITIKINGVTHSKVLMENGKLQQRNASVTYKGGQNDGPTDQVTFGATDVIADAFGLSPRRPVVMFDPGRVKYDEVATNVQDCVRKEDGSLILPVIEPVNGLTMKQILKRAYTGSGGTIFVNAGASPLWAPMWSVVENDQLGCGFSNVITNIRDYKVRRADFTIEGGWHDGATPVVTMYAPLYFTEGDVLFIIDPDRVLPYGASVHTLTLGDHKSLTETITYKPDTNAVLLTYQYAINDPLEEPNTKDRRMNFTDSTDESGSPGTADYSKVVTRRWDYEEFSTVDDSVLATYPKSVDIETYQTVLWPVKHPTSGEISYTNLGVFKTHQETSDYTYQGDMMITLRKISKGIINVGLGGGASLIELEREDTRITWQDDPYNPGSKIQARVITDIRGHVFYNKRRETVQTSTGSLANVVRAIPALLAQSSGILLSGSVMSQAMHPIKSIRQTLQNVSGRQYNAEVVEIDYLNNTMKRSYTEPTTASVSTNQFGHKTRTVLFRDLDSEAVIGSRIPVPVNSFELPRSMAFELARNTMHRIKNPLMLMPIALPGVDFTIARGSVIRGQKRDESYSANYFVTGYEITGTNLGKQGHRITQTLEAIELLTVS